ncbi:striatin-3-like protein [Lates japonicus]|uniref:Striatin-3-like protein n=1 Tax=Lates japonicus TaxID=270547 RepID=A0AAD3NG41_LATJO|nr:striatin-3-like protein [Lates japonicus]
MDDISTDKHHRAKKHKTKVGNEGLASEDDADTEEALKEFDFLVTAEDGEGAGEARSSGDGTEWAEPLPFPTGGGKSFLLGGSDDVLESVLGLGDLADLNVTNDETDYSYDLPSSKESSFRKTWNPKYTLRSHFDGTVPAKKSASFDVEPIYTFRAHVGPVLSLAMTSSGEQCFSGGIDSTIQWWNIPSSTVDPYDTYDPSVLAGSWAGHTDAVWGIGLQRHQEPPPVLLCRRNGQTVEPNREEPLHLHFQHKQRARDPHVGGL